MIQTWRYPRTVLLRRFSIEGKLIENEKLRKEAAQDEV